MKKALLWTPLSNNRVKCHLCPHSCNLKEGQPGICMVRKNVRGELISLNYDKIAAIHSDPIEKKPLYHVLPGSQSLSIATMGCNFSCAFCQNHSLSMVGDQNQIFGEKKSPEDLIALALESGARSISYTYTEPTVFFELMLETAKLARQNGLKNIMVSNGYMSHDALSMIAPYLDAANIDLKAFSDEFYRKYCNARLEPVIKTIKAMRELGIWIELTTLLIPGLNDNQNELEQLIQFIFEMGDSIPWHLSRFFPHYQLLETSPTDVAVIISILQSAGDKGIKFLYGGNFSSAEWTNTICPECGTLLIERNGYSTEISGLDNGRCSGCGILIPGIWT
jgi:pyruvate formate lyase activating enzyme